MFELLSDHVIATHEALGTERQFVGNWPFQLSHAGCLIVWLIKRARSEKILLKFYGLH